MSIDYGRVWRDTQSRTPQIVLPISTAYGARLGPRSLLIASANERVALSGIVEVTGR